MIGARNQLPTHLVRHTGHLLYYVAVSIQYRRLIYFRIPLPGSDTTEIKF